MCQDTSPLARPPAMVKQKRPSPDDEVVDARPAALRLDFFDLPLVSF